MHRSSTSRPHAPQPVFSAVVDANGARVPAEALHFGALLQARGLISARQLEHALTLQAQSPYLRIGEILLGLGYISFAQLKHTLEDQYHDVWLGKSLLANQAVSIEILAQALAMQERNGGRLAPILIDMGACTEAQIYQALASTEA